LEDVPEESGIANTAVVCLIDVVHKEGSPRIHGRVDIAKRPFIGRKLAVWMHVVGQQHELDLLLREIGVNQGQRHAVKA
jgi:hypothetical protein